MEALSIQSVINTILIMKGCISYILARLKASCLVLAKLLGFTLGKFTLKYHGMLSLGSPHCRARYKAPN